MADIEETSRILTLAENLRNAAQAKHVDESQADELLLLREKIDFIEANRGDDNAVNNLREKLQAQCPNNIELQETDCVKLEIRVLEIEISQEESEISGYIRQRDAAISACESEKKRVIGTIESIVNQQKGDYEHLTDKALTIRRGFSSHNNDYHNPNSPDQNCSLAKALEKNDAELYPEVVKPNTVVAQLKQSATVMDNLLQEHKPNRGKRILHWLTNNDTWKFFRKPLFANAIETHKDVSEQHSLLTTAIHNIEESSFYKMLTRGPSRSQQVEDKLKNSREYQCQNATINTANHIIDKRTPILAGKREKLSNLKSRIEAVPDQSASTKKTFSPS